MSLENLDVVRKAFEAFGVGGADAVLPFYKPDVVIYPTAAWVEDPLYRGRDGARKVTAWIDGFDELSFEPREIRDLQERVIVFAELSGRIRSTDTLIQQGFGMVLSDFGDGMIGEVRYFLTWQETLEAVGLEE